jgi:hypothetical protein
VKDPRNTLAVKYARFIKERRFENAQFFVGIVEAMVARVERQDKGKGNQNFTYNPLLEEWAGVCAVTSPRTYRLLAQQLQLPSERHLA